MIGRPAFHRTFFDVKVLFLSETTILFPNRSIFHPKMIIILCSSQLRVDDASVIGLSEK